MSVLLNVLVGAFFFVLGLFVAVYIRRPTLKVRSGSGGRWHPTQADGFAEWRINVTNAPGLLGVRLRPTTLFGRSIHGPFAKGLTLERDRALRVHATLLDKNDHNKVLAGLWMRGVAVEGATGWEPAPTIQSGETWEIGLFVCLNVDPARYWVFRPTDQTNSDMQPVIGPDISNFADRHSFRIELRYQDGTRKARLDGAMHRSTDNSWRWEERGFPFNRPLW